jgi:hypothetical protein
MGEHSETEELTATMVQHRGSLAGRSASATLFAALIVVAAACGSGGDSSTQDAAESVSGAAAPSAALATAVPSTSKTTTLPTTTTTSLPPTTLPPTTTTSTTTTTTTTTLPPTTTITTTQPLLGGTATACQGVALIGDSTAVGLDGSNGVLSGADTIGAQLAAIGVADLRLDVSRGRSIVETLADQTNGPEAINAIQSTGFAGCWVILLGTNDAANIAAGSNADAAQRVGRILDAVAGEPTLWLTASTMRTDGFWARPNTLVWNDQLRSLVSQASSVGMADWDGVASQQAWFVSDGIHPNSTGLAARSRFIADNLRVFFPA